MHTNNFLQRSQVVLFFKLLFALSICMVSIKILGFPNAYYVEAIVVIVTITMSLYELNKRMSLKEMCHSLKSKIVKK